MGLGDFLAKALGVAVAEDSGKGHGWRLCKFRDLQGRPCMRHDRHQHRGSEHHLTPEQLAKRRESEVVRSHQSPKLTPWGHHHRVKIWRD
jgi:hypothetical protein